MKRFIDDRIWVDAWFCKLSSDFKLVWIYLFTNCSKIGIWEENMEELEYRLKSKINVEELKKIFSEKVTFGLKEWLIKNFILIQYPSLLIKPNSPLHISVFKELNKKGLNLIGNSLLIDYTYPMDSLQVKEEVKEEVKAINTTKDINNKNKHFFIVPPHLENIWPRVLEMRKKIKKPMTDYAQELAIDKLSEMGDESMQIKIVKQTIERSYSGFFPVAEKKESNKFESEEETYQRAMKQVEDNKDVLR